MTNLKPITILSQNLIDEASSTLFAAGGSAAVLFNFPSPVRADTLLLKNSNISGVLVEFKEQEEAAFSALPALNCEGGKDIVLTFPNPVEAKIIKFTFTSQKETCYIGKMILARELISLDNVLSSLAQNSFTRGGHHYLADGSLVKWTEFVKQTPSLRLDNVKKETKDFLLNLLEENTFLTYLFYGPAEAGLSGEFALSKPPLVSPDRKTFLYRVDLNLAER